MEDWYAYLRDLLRTRKAVGYLPNPRPAVEIYLRQYARSEGIRLLEFYSDWRRVSEALEGGKADAVLVFSIRDVAKSPWEAARLYFKFVERGWRIYSAAEPWLGAVGPIRRVVEGLLRWIAEERHNAPPPPRETKKRRRRRVSRPRRWTPEIRQRIVELVERGVPTTTACVMAGISISTAYRYLPQSLDYQIAVKKAITQGLRRKWRGRPPKNARQADAPSPPNASL